jgi:PAS domain S-box-containing protein
MRPRHLTTQFALAIAGLVIVSLGGLSGLAITVTRRSVREQIGTSNTTTAALAARAIEQYVTVSVSIVEEAAQRPKLSQDIRAANWPEVSRVLDNIAQHFSQFDYVFVQDVQGVIKARAPDAETVGQDFSFRPFFQEAKRTRQPYVSGVYTSKAARHAVVTIAMPASDGRGGVAGVLCVALSLARMSQFLNGFGGSHGAVVSLVDRAGMLVADSRGVSLPTPVPMGDRPIVQAVLAGRTGTMEFRESGESGALLGAHVPITQLGWGVVVAYPAAAAYARVTQFAWWLVSITLGCTVAAVLVGLGLTHRLTGPLRRVSEATQQLAAGEFRNAQVPVVGPAEVATLATSFNRMATRIEVSHQALESKAEEVKAANQALARELEERQQAEAALQGSNLTLRGLIQAAPLAIWVLDADGRVQLWNPAAQRIFGWTEQEAVGRILPIVPENQTADFRRLFERALQGEMLPGLELRRQKKDGTLVPVSVAVAALYGPTGTVQGTIAIVADLTERTTLEEQVRQLQKMEAIGRLAGGIAHDFNNLLTVITGRTQLALGRAGLDEVTLGALKLIDRTAERAGLLTRQLLAFSRKQVLHPEVLSLSDLVGHLEPMLRRLIREDIELVTVLVAGTGHVRADASQIEQVVLNLVVNARDAMPDGGCLTIETAEVELPDEFADRPGALPAGAYVMLRVADTGIGMDAHVQGLLFEPFFTTKEPGKGTGLGLATVHGIVSQSGGVVRVYSAPGEGATFKIYLPRVTGAAGTTPAPEGRRESPRGTETILLVEDEEEVRALARDILVMGGYTVLDAAGPEEALRRSTEHAGPIHLLITDVVMPTMSGPDLARWLVVRRSGMKVLCMSGYPEGATAHGVTLAPDTLWLQKPFTPESLSERVRQILDGGLAG